MTAGGIDGAVADALGRAALCRALARALDYPSRVAHVEALARLDGVLAATVPSAAALRTTVAAARDALATAGASLEAEHVRLFGPAGCAPMVETAWGDAGRLLGKPATLADLGGFYRAFGVTPATASPRPEDDLTVELEFLAVLALKEAWAVAEGLADGVDVTRDATAAFLREHLGCWTAAWRTAVAAGGAPPAYAALADAVAELVAAECARVGVTPHVVATRLHDRACGGDDFSCPMAEGARRSAPEDPCAPR